MSTGPRLSLLPSAMMQFPRAQHAIAPIRVALPETERAVGLVTLKGRSISPVLDTFLKQARKTTGLIMKGPTTHQTAVPKS
jgi:hypothetical protein